MSRLFISHAGAETPQALALGEWLEEQGYVTDDGKPDYFIDCHPDRGLIAGEEWKRALRAAVDRCEAILCLVSTAWLKSPWCLAEANTAELLHKPIIVILLEPLTSKDLPASLTQYQLCRLAGPDPLRTFASGIALSEDGLAALAEALKRSHLAPSHQGDDIIYGGVGSAIIYGGVGSNIISGDGGNDSISGDGIDTSIYSSNAPPNNLMAFGVSHPTTIATDQAFQIRAWIFPPQMRDALRQQITSDPKHPAELQDHGATRVEKGSQITLRLHADNARVEPSTQQLIWTGALASVPFRLTPSGGPKGALITGKCTISASGLRIGTVFFEVPIQANASDPASRLQAARLIETAFASYASQDRRDVLPRIQGIEKLGVRVKMDVRDFVAGGNFPQEIKSAIDSSDTLYLFWSRNAERSRWVEREWRYGLTQKGIDFIDPVPLVDPRRVRPPKELAESKHFNDWVLAYLAYEAAAKPWWRFWTRRTGR